MDNIREIEGHFTSIIFVTKMGYYFNFFPTSSFFSLLHFYYLYSLRNYFHSENLENEESLSKYKMIKNKTVHTARTLMFTELSKVMDFSIESDNYFQSLENNILGKKSQNGIKQTTGFLTILYIFDIHYNPFKVFKEFWLRTDEYEKPVVALLFALTHDYLLSESISIVSGTDLSAKVDIERIESNIEKYHPNRFTKNTLRSVAQNVASSWKQAGFITGKVKNIRTQPSITYNMVAFAFIMAYLDGLRGDFILSSKWVKALCLEENITRELAVEASQRGLIQYHFLGDVTSVTCNEFFNKLQINVI